MALANFDFEVHRFLFSFASSIYILSSRCFKMALINITKIMIVISLNKRKAFKKTEKAEIGNRKRVS